LLVTKQVEKSIKGAKITGYRSQYAPPAPANATEFASAVAPSPASAAKSTFADALASSSSPARAAPASAAESASADSLGSASSPGPAALAATPASAAVPASAPSPRHHLCSAEKVSFIPHMHFDGSLEFLLHYFWVPIVVMWRFPFCDI
jgi:hypothetical protein